MQREVILSTIEAEYIVATETCRCLQWVKILFEELSLHELIDGSQQTNLYINNQSTISLIKNNNNHKRSKQVRLHNHFCREQYEGNEIIPVYVESKL